MKNLNLLRYPPSVALSLTGSLLLSAQQPHIILIITDQQRADALGCMDNPSVISPHIDQLAQEGTRFMSGYSSTPSSTPARAGLLTGMAPWNHGMLGYGEVAPQYKYEMPQQLRELNYYAFGIGKMHWNPQRSLRGFNGALLDESGRVEADDFISDYRLWFQLYAPGKDPDVTGIGWNEHAAGIFQLEEKLHPTYWTGQTAVTLIENYDHDQPLFLKVSFARPHSPYDPPQRFLDLYEKIEIPAPYRGEWCKQFSKPLDPAYADKNAAYANFGDSYAMNSRRHYYASITFIDEQVGEIVQALKEKGMYDNSLICFVSDHGDMMGDHYHWRKTYPYEGSAKVPFLLKWPENRGYPKGERKEDPVELRDILPTFIEAGGGNIPEDMDGRSLFSLMDGKEWRKYIDLEHATCYRKENYWCALTNGKVKYVWNFYTGEEELFDLVNDPGEVTNQISNTRYSRVLDNLRKEMVIHLSVRGEEFVKNGKPVIRKEPMIYSPNYPGELPEEVEIILLETVSF